MITTFFRTSKPHHYFIFLFVLFSMHVFQRLGLLGQEFQGHNYVVEIIDLFALFGILFLVVFIITKNNLTQNNSLAAAYFCLFTVVIPEVISTHEILVSNLFVLMAYRRIFSMRTGLNLKKKYLDATLWLCISALIYPLAILFFAPLFLAIIQFQSDKLKHVLVVIFGIISMALLVFLSHQIFETTLPWDGFSKQSIGFDFTSFKDLFLLTSLGLFAILSAWAIFALFNERISKSKFRFTFITLIFMCVIAITVVLISNPKSPTQLLFMLFPLSVLFANISEISQLRWISDIIMIILVLLTAMRLTFNILDIHFLY